MTINKIWERVALISAQTIKILTLILKPPTYTVACFSRESGSNFTLVGKIRQTIS